MVFLRNTAGVLEYIWNFTVTNGAVGIPSLYRRNSGEKNIASEFRRKSFFNIILSGVMLPLYSGKGQKRPTPQLLKYQSNWLQTLSQGLVAQKDNQNVQWYLSNCLNSVDVSTYFYRTDRYQKNKISVSRLFTLIRPKH